ncbi:MAG: DUF4011 domain-containing protein, partial [Muribaculaceae bacterium]|nr:DUF4011 domain-containing protein [Muribaculaceae bacterium]
NYEKTLPPDTKALAPDAVESEDSAPDEEIEEGEIIGFDHSPIDSTRREGWERRLLDLSLRNPMLNLRIGKGLLPVRDLEPAEVIKLLKSGRLAKHLGRPDIDLPKQLKALYRASVNRLEENGANTFFVTLGALRWFDVTGNKPHISPIIFIPANIARQGDLTYSITLRDDEMMLNVTLIEMLRQKFGITLPDLDPIPYNDDGFPDWERILAVFSQPLAEVNERLAPERRWSVRNDSFAGVFIFQKYLLWHDIHNNPSVIAQHPILSAMIEQHIELKPQPVDAHSIEAENPLNLMLPIDYDSSQLEAVALSHANNSFVLHGPPGTGKSQTISNMIADAIYSGKKVLFVSEKKAALDVVRTRLNSIGLKNHCLELHSNKTDKRSFFTQIMGAGLSKVGTGGAEQKEVGYDNVAEIFLNCRDRINEVAEAIHDPKLSDTSLYDFINRFNEIHEPEYLQFKYSEIKHLSFPQIKELCELYASLDLISQVLRNHPADHPLKGLYPKENSIENQQQLTQLIPALADEIQYVRKKANGFLNRMLIRKTPEQILYARPTWEQINRLATLDVGSQPTFDEISEYVDRWKENLDLLHKWYLFTEKREKIVEFNVPKVLDFYFEKNSGQSTASKLEKGYLKTQIDRQVITLPPLRLFNGSLHEQQLLNYRLAANSLQKHAQGALVKELENKKLSISLTPKQLEEKAVLMRRTFSYGRGVPLRKAIAESESLIQILFPCMLMSPLSVAQYLEMRPGMFDMVIFDEASQMETPDAIGAIARGKSLIVVGDPMQLPPTRFFTAQATGGEDSPENEDADSILEECITLGLPSHYLSRHYRSRHESLIAFSNTHFYNNRLLTFPSYNDTQRKVTCINPKGIYDIGYTRTNRIEAEAVVDYILNILRSSDDSPPSIGVVAFSKVQSELIEDILNDRLLDDRVLRRKLESMEEPLFIKNLENVQGDERDIIVFSVGYGPDVNGNVSLNFGPINKVGGERRLNVAVTRAREEMAVFSSLLPQHIPEEGVNSKGVVALRNFLKYASDIQDASLREKSDSQNEAMIEDIVKRLRDLGHCVHTHVGRSSFKVDIAIVDPDNPDQYKYGITLDGRDYYKLPTVRDREITVRSVLRNLGWNLKRIWVLDYLENPDLVIQHIFD